MIRHTLLLVAENIAKEEEVTEPETTAERSIGVAGSTGAALKAKEAR